jgi:hypothetical protein
MLEIIVLGLMGKKKTLKYMKVLIQLNFGNMNSRIARRWNVDPVVKEHESPYAAFANNPIWFTDPDGADTLKYKGTEEESKKIVTAISEQFDADLDYIYTKDKDGIVNGVDIYGLKGSGTGNAAYDKLRGFMTDILNKGTHVVQIEKVIDVPKRISEVEKHGGMMFTTEGGTPKILITEQYLTGIFASGDFRIPRYTFAYNEAARFPYYFNPWSTLYAVKGYRGVPFSEGLGHELVHYYRYKNNTLLSSRRSEENATKHEMNIWRLSMGIPTRPYNRFSSGFMGLGAGYKDEVMFEDEDDYDAEED